MLRFRYVGAVGLGLVFGGCAPSQPVRPPASQAEAMPKGSANTGLPLGSQVPQAEMGSAPVPLTPMPTAQSAGGGSPPDAPSQPDARASYGRANVQLSEARRALEVASQQRECANACRALESMERAASQICLLAQGADEQRTCSSAQELVGSARERVRGACGGCARQPR
jgi:hypothetical protein